MSEPTSQPTPAGWYPDHGQPGQQRWWDGTRWTEHTQQAYVQGGAVEQLRAPAGTSWNTPWIWLVLLLPLLNNLPLLFVDWQDYLVTTLEEDTGGMMRSLFSPAMVLSQILPWLMLGLSALFSYFDYRELQRRGVPRPFHWAFGFLGIVYPIGRAVVTNRRGIGGLVVLWVAIAVILAGLIAGIAFAAVMMGQFAEVIPTMIR